MSVVDSYAEAIVRRARESMEPQDFEPDWADQPRRHKYYPAAEHFSLPSTAPLPGTLDEGLDPDRSAESTGSWSAEALSALLMDSYGLTGRRLAVHGNPDLRGMPWYPSATWSRGTASGGGLYPLEVYLVTGPGGPLTPGVYNYSSPHHSMQRLLTGDVTAHVHHALPAGSPYTGQYLLVSVKFWKNSFKYSSFCYHAVTMDLGTLLGTWRTSARAAGLALRPYLWFDEPSLDRLLGLDHRDESVMAVVPLPWRGRRPETPSVPARAPSVELTELERSRETVSFSWVTEVHEQTLDAPAVEPAPEQLEGARAAPFPSSGDTDHRLPEPRLLEVPVASALRERRSSFGRFSSSPPMARADLSTILMAADRASTLLGEVGTSRLSVFANHVADLSPGAYDHMPEGALRPLREGSVADFLQSNYFLNNYNLEQCAAVITVMASPTAMTSAVGPRGYRLVNAEVGAVAQSVYLACAALGLGCGAALGFDNVSYRDELRIEDRQEWPLLILMVGHERAGQPEFVYRNV